LFFHVRSIVENVNIFLIVKIVFAME